MFAGRGGGEREERRQGRAERAAGGNKASASCPEAGCERSQLTADAGIYDGIGACETTNTRQDRRHYLLWAELIKSEIQINSYFCRVSDAVLTASAAVLYVQCLT